MHGHVLEVVKSLLELVNNIINRVMHVGKYICTCWITHARNNRIIPLCFILLSHKMIILQYTKWILPLYPSDNLLSGFRVLSSGLRNLEELDLRSNKLNDNILSFLSEFWTLKSIDLSNNRFTGSTGLNGKVVNHSYLGWHSLVRFNNYMCINP